MRPGRVLLHVVFLQRTFVTFVETTQPGSRPSLPVRALDYTLPERLIATRPAQPRDAARLLVVRRSTDELTHATVRDLPAFLRAEDRLIFNTTRVLPARLIAQRVDSEGRVEGLLIEPRPDGMWKGMLKSNGKLRAGQRIELLDHDNRPGGAILELVARDDAEWLVRLEGEDPMERVLERLGRTPLPPYILRARQGSEQIDDAADRAWYQTVFAAADSEEPVRPREHHSVAAPTAGLHFTADLLARLRERGVIRRDLVLHVGPGTFKPVTADDLADHIMHREWFEVPPETLADLAALSRSRSEGNDEAREDAARIIAVGTTTVRTLESLPTPLPADVSSADGPLRGGTDLLIAPPYEFRYLDGMLTNFHLPRSTLLALVAAMVGLERLHEIYAEAIAREYRFYSYGDAMLILP
ncbi:MAG: tRNA preQ1(34) S-adenosylmethionine ribosyltransferase-isomerase QueA [Phycisphaerales bacterium]|nr:MAG: tRNA preQ1(34) S-adenosylmethionine ribosyltransferase-isomerase QueA [Phycisphaerales bacterium]